MSRAIPRVLAVSVVVLAGIALVMAIIVDQGNHGPATSSPLELGTLAAEPSRTNCAPGSECIDFSVSCGGLAEPAAGGVRIGRHQGQARGMAVFFSGGPGRSWWSGDRRAVRTLFDDLRTQGITVVEVRWQSWLDAAPEEQAGPARLACRPATAIRWLHDTHFAPLGVTAAEGRCGFCLTGNSGGASQISYALSHYGLDSMIDGVFPTGGPPHADLARGCLAAPDEEDAYGGTDGAATVDSSYGFSSDGPCARRNEAFVPAWQRDSVASGGSDYAHPGTRISLLVGEDDARMRPQASAYADRLRAAGTSATVDVLPETGHDIAASPRALALLRTFIMDG